MAIGWACPNCIHVAQHGQLPPDFPAEDVPEYWLWVNRQDVTKGGTLRLSFLEDVKPCASEPLCCDVCTVGLDDDNGDYDEDEELIGLCWKAYRLVPADTPDDWQPQHN